MDLGISGLASGFDWRSLVDQLVEIERVPQTRLRNEQNLLQQRNNAYSSIKTQLGVLNNRLESLKDASFFDTRTSASSDTTLAAATASEGAALGSYEFSVLQYASAAKQSGTANAGAALNPTNDVSALTLGTAKFATGVTAGTFTVNGEQITIATTDTLQDVFDAINTATSGAMTGGYDSTTDRITFSSGSAIVLGSATDTSNFLQVAKLYNNGTGTVTSNANLGAIKLNEALSSANFSTAISDGGAGLGEFKINGISIAFNAGTDSVSAVLTRINNSAAAVTATYDAENDRFVLTNKKTGDLGIALEDVTGNFLAATKLSTGALQSGQDLQYTINGGPTLTSHSNTITEDSSGIAGLKVDLLKASTAAASSTTTTTTTTSNGLNYAASKIVSVFGGAGANATRITFPSTHAFTTGQTSKLQSSGTLPAGVNATTTYYVRNISTTQISLHTTLAGAVANTGAINFGASPPYTGDAFVVPYNPVSTSSTTTTTTTTGSGSGPVATFSVDVGSDTAKIKTAIKDFITEFNKVQSVISAQTASSTDANGKVTAGLLAADSFANEISSKLRSLANATVAGLSGVFKRLDDIGIASNGDDDSLEIDDEELLDDALANNLVSLKDLFTEATNGLGVELADYVERTSGEEGALETTQESLTKQAGDIDTQIADLERIVQSNRQRMIDSFVAMEAAQAKINQQLQFLLQRFGTSTS